MRPAINRLPYPPMQQPATNDTTATPQPSPPKPPPRREEHKETLSETIQSILVAFILAFVFRAFVVEAFVIPSGSMAPTLLGAHMRLVCKECGYPFSVNYPTSGGTDDSLKIPDRAPAVFSMHCPNCGFKVQRDGTGPADSPPIDVYYGDRILVLKYLYLIQQPQRWDVVVFKSPSDPNFAQNFIKRLVGKPGETLMVLDGDIYACPNAEASWKGDPLINGEPLNIEKWPWKVQTKPREVQNALWRVVYDQDHQPRNAAWRSPQWIFPWQLGPGWARTADRRLLSFDDRTGTGTGALVFNNDANDGAFPLTDWLPYNESHSFKTGSPVRDAYTANTYAMDILPRWYVSDLQIRFAYRRNAGDGPMRASLTKLQHTFTAEIFPDRARLIHRLPDGTTRTIAEAPIHASIGAELNVELMNVDYCVTLRLDGRDLIRTTPKDYAPDLPALLKLHRQRNDMAGASHELIRSVFGIPRAQLDAERQACQITHLSLWRDGYYTPSQGYARPSELIHGSPEHPIRLAGHADAMENEFFVLGDNSILSSDARYWTQRVDLLNEGNLQVRDGRVPQRFLLGKAFFVYWPAGFRPFSSTVPGIIPNFGDMRMIH